MTLHVGTAGDPNAPAIFFLHGAGIPGWMWEPQVAALSARFRCIVPDLPGHGESKAVAWVSIADTAAQVAQIIREQAQGRAHVVGLSLGAQIVLQLHNDYPDVVDHAIMSGLRLVRSRLAESMAGLNAPLMRMEWLVRATAKQMVPASYIERFVAEAKGEAPATLLKVAEDSLRFTLPANLPKAYAPSLILAGEKEPSLIKDSLPVAVQALSNVHARIAPKVNHVWNLENPALFNRTVEAWLTDQPLPAELISISNHR